MGIKFTEKLVRDLELGSGIHRDETVKGLMVVCHKTTKTYSVQTDLRRNKRLVKSLRLKIDRCDRISLAEARNKARELLSKIQSGIDPTETLTSSGLTLSEVLTYHLNERELSDQTFDNYNYHLEKYLKRFKKKAVADISRSDIRELLAELTRKHGKTTASTAMRTFRTLMNTAMRLDESISENPVNSIRLPQIPKRQVEELDFLEFWQNTSKLSPGMRDLHRMFLITGARRGSMLPVLREDVDLEKNVLKFTHFKTGGEFLYPIGHRTAALLRNRMEEDEPFKSKWLWPSATSSCGHIVETKRPNIPSPHKLRHTTRTMLIAAGIPFTESGLLVGHKFAGASGGYVHPSHLLEALRPFAQTWEDFLFSRATKIVANSCIQQGDASLKLVAQ